MNGKWPVIAIVAATVATGAGVWYAQVWAFYDRLDPATVTTQITATRPDGTLALLPAATAEGIDSTSSPLRWRACFTLSQMPEPAVLTPYPNAEPIVGPGWFPCYEAGAVTAALASGEARAYLGASEVRPDVDRVIALWPDGHGVGWHQFNDKNPAPGVMD